MSIWSRVSGWLAPGPVSAAQPLREAVGVTVDGDEDQWRRLTGNSRRDLTPLTQRRMRELALYLWESNNLANRLIELPVAYILAEGVSLQVTNPEAQAWLNSFWNDPINNMDLKLDKKVRELAIYGEQCWPAFTNEMNGHVRLGYLDPELIATVVTDPDNAEQVIGIVTTKDGKGRARRYRVIVNGPETVFSAKTRGIRETFEDGECFYYRINDLSNGQRGRSDLLASIDWLDGYDQFLFGELDRSQFMRAFIWDVTLKGSTPDEVKARARQIAAPKAGSVRVHNDSEEWKAETPDLKAQDSDTVARLFRNHVLGGSTLPEHWFGGGGDVNRATAGEMGDPTFKVMSRRQLYWKHILEDVAKFVIARRLDPSGQSGFDALGGEPDLMPEAVFPELTAKDTTKYAAALQQVVAAASVAVERGLVSEVFAVKLIAAVAGRLGVECDPEEELNAAKQEAAKRRENDLFTDPPDEPEVTDRDGDGSGAE